MALQQPTLLSSTCPTPSTVPQQHVKSPQSPLQSQVEEQHEWILFPRSQSLHHVRSESSDLTPRTAGLSRLSDFGSLNATERSLDNQARDAIDALDAAGDEDLDSLDDGLNAFHSNLFQPGESYRNQSGPIFPRHDGLGSFPASSPAVQEQIRRFEQAAHFKPSANAHSRRASSVKRKLDEVEEDDEAKLEDEKRERIEHWRLEHSRILLDEIEKETRRRQSIARSQSTGEEGDAHGSKSAVADGPQDRDSYLRHQSATDSESEGFLQKLTRRVIRNVIGIDEDVLAVILGEALSESESSQTPTDYSTAPIPNPNLSWHSRLLNRLALELGILLDQLTEYPSIYPATSSHDPTIPDYAGIPITQPTSSKTHPPRRLSTAADSAHASLWGIEEEPLTPSAPSTQVDHAYWEQPPNLSNVLGVFKTHFAPHSTPSATASTQTKSTLATTLTPEIIRRAALIRQYHPIINTASSSALHERERPRRRSGLSRFGAGSLVGSSCGSQSLRRSSFRGSVSGASVTTVTSYGRGGGSSRNYWDVGGGWGEI